MKNINYLVFLIFLIVQACTNITKKGASLTNTTGINFNNLNTSTNYTHYLSGTPTIVQLTSNGNNANPDYQLSLTTDSTKPAYQSLMGFCGGSTNPCDCELDWTEVSTSGGINTSYQRTKKVPIAATDVQSALVKCTIPYNVWSQIPNGTVVTMNIVPISPNTTGLNVKSIGFKVGTSTGINGDFIDNTLTPFQDIHRYTCFTKTAKPYEILNQYFPASPSQTPASGTAPTINLSLASKFCTMDQSASGGNANGGSNGSGQCLTPRNGWSAQSYYRNFYIRSALLGEINSTNGNFDCPEVVTPITASANNGNVTKAAYPFWPMDTTFALAVNYSSDWSVGVRAASILLKSGDPNSTQDLCVGEADSSKRLVEAGTVTKCLGYAKRPNVDGTCGTITDGNGRVRPLTRLRRYRVVYPPVFMSSGNVSATNPNADEIYVADRLVVNSSGVPTGAMIYGPKPCNSAWFDHEGIVTRTLSTNAFKSNFISTDSAGLISYGVPAYVATSKYYYQYTSNDLNQKGKIFPVNPDGLMFPNQDLPNDATKSQNASCSATLPVVLTQSGSPNAMRLLTINQSRTNNTDSITLGSRTVYLNEVHVQPIDPWIPNYVEDTSFQACAPLSDSDKYVEPPLHFYKNASGSMEWCAEVYPTQNPYWADLNQIKRPTGSGDANIVNYPTVATPNTTALVQNFTSHVNANALSMTDPDPYLDSKNSCSGDLGSYICSMSGATTQNFCITFLNKLAGVNTCDRTVIFDGNQQSRGFPLLAQDSDIHDMLYKDSISAQPTFSCQYSVNSDSSKVNSKVPSSGCCGLDNGTPVLNGLLGAPAASGGHLEPYQASGAPTGVRFCGYPVE